MYNGDRAGYSNPGLCLEYFDLVIIAAIVVVIDVGEGPVHIPAVDIRIGCSQVEACQGHTADTNAGTAAAVGQAVIGAFPANNTADGIDLFDDDGHTAVLIEIVGAAVESPVGGAAGNIGEGCTQVEAGQEGIGQAGAGASWRHGAGRHSRLPSLRWCRWRRSDGW